MTKNWAYLEKSKHSWIPTKAAPPKAASPDFYHPEAWKAFKENCRVDSIQVLKTWTIGTTAGLEAASGNTQPSARLKAQHSFSRLKKHYLFLQPENNGMLHFTVVKRHHDKAYFITESI